jgi:four helix bundle protein
MNYEKLIVWKESVQLSAGLYKYLKSLKDYGFKDQITRSGLSVPSNIAEGVARFSIKEKAHFLAIAKGSCAELRTQIYIGIEIGYIDQVSGMNWLKEANSIDAMLPDYETKF